VRDAVTICPAPVTLTLNLLTLKVVSESRVTWATSVPILVFPLPGLSVLHLGPMYATDRRQTASLAPSVTNERDCPRQPRPRQSSLQAVQWAHRLSNRSRFVIVNTAMLTPDFGDVGRKWASSYQRSADVQSKHFRPLVLGNRPLIRQRAWRTGCRLYGHCRRTS